MKIEIQELNGKNGADVGPQQRRSAWIGFASVWTTICVFSLAAGALWFAQRARAGSTVSSAEIDAALQSTLATVLTNKACPQDPQALEDFVAACFVLARPDLVQRDLQADPVFAARQAQAQWTFLHPDATFQALVADPEQRKACQEAYRAIMVSPPPESGL